MNEPFDPYHIWLGIPPAEQPPNYYRLLGIQVGESNIEVIERAADGRALQLKTAQAGKRSDLSQRLLNEVSAAKVCLLNPGRKGAYDALLAKKSPTEANSALGPQKAAGETLHFALSARQPSRTHWNLHGRKKSGTPYFEGVKIVVGGVAGLFLAVLVLSYFAGIDPLGWGKNSQKALDKNVANRSKNERPPAVPSVIAKQGRVPSGKKKKAASDIIPRRPVVPIDSSTSKSNQGFSSKKAIPFPAVPTEPNTPSAATSSGLEEESEERSLSAKIKADPNDAQSWRQRAKLHHRWHHWGQAADDYQQLLRLAPDNLWEWPDLAITSLAAGREEDYLRHCRDIEERLNALTATDILHTRAARLLSLRPGGFADGEKLLVAAAKMAENSSEWWLVHPQVPLLYRLGRYDQALREARRIEPTSLTGDARAPLHAWEAMILWRLDRRPEARDALVLAKRHIEDSRGLRGLTEGSGDQVIEAEIALREAETLLTEDAGDKHERRSSRGRVKREVRSQLQKTE